MRTIESITTYNSGTFPNTLGTNSSGPSTKDGTELIANLFNDYIGVLPQALLNEMSITPSGNAETATDSQQMMALIGMMQRYGSAYGCVGSADIDALHDVQISVGQVPDSTRAYTLRLTSAIAKQGDVAWAAGGTPGTPAGGLMGGTWSASTEYGVFLIYNPTTKVTDAGFSVYTGAGVPTFLPAGFTVYQMVDWVITDGSSQILQTKTYDRGNGVVFKQRTAPFIDILLTNALGTTRRNDAVTVPTGFECLCDCNYQASDAASNFVIIVNNPDQSDIAPGSGTAVLANITSQTGVTAYGQIQVLTNTSAQIASRSDLSTVDLYRIAVQSFLWKRF